MVAMPPRSWSVVSQGIFAGFLHQLESQVIRPTYFPRLKRGRSMQVENWALPRMLTNAALGDLVSYVDGDDHILGILAAFPAEVMEGREPTIQILELTSPHNEGQPYLRDLGWPDMTAAAVYQADQVWIVPNLLHGLVETTGQQVQFKVGQLIIGEGGVGYIVGQAGGHGGIRMQRRVVNVSTGQILPPPTIEPKMAFNSWRIVRRGEFADETIFEYPQRQ